MPNAALLEADIEIKAPIGKVWDLIADLRNMPRWSPMTRKMFVRGPVLPGARVINYNRKAWRVWPTRAVLTAVEPNKKLAWFVKDNLSEWSYELEPAARGITKVTERRVMGDRRSAVSSALQTLLFGGTDLLDHELLQGMKLSLSRIKDAAEDATNGSA